MFKATVKHEPYFYIVTRRGKEAEVEEWLVKQYEGNLLRLARERKEDLKLVGMRRLRSEGHLAD